MRLSLARVCVGPAMTVPGLPPRSMGHFRGRGTTLARKLGKVDGAPPSANVPEDKDTTRPTSSRA